MLDIFSLLIKSCSGTVAMSFGSENEIELLSLVR